MYGSVHYHHYYDADYSRGRFAHYDNMFYDDDYYYYPRLAPYHIVPQSNRRSRNHRHRHRSSPYLTKFQKSHFYNKFWWAFEGCTHPEKEVTESMGMLEAYQDLQLEDKNVVLVVVGDGSTPRTGLMCGVYTKIEKIYSVDPKMKRVDYSNRVVSIVGKIEDVVIDGDNKDVVMMFPHSHAGISASIARVQHAKTITVINMPCCVDPDVTYKPDISYTDKSITSDRNHVDIYLNVQDRHPTTTTAAAAAAAVVAAAAASIEALKTGDNKESDSNWK